MGVGVLRCSRLQITDWNKIFGMVGKMDLTSASIILFCPNLHHWLYWSGMGFTSISTLSTRKFTCQQRVQPSQLRIFRIRMVRAKQGTNRRYYESKSSLLIRCYCYLHSAPAHRSMLIHIHSPLVRDWYLPALRHHSFSHFQVTYFSLLFWKLCG